MTLDRVWEEIRKISQLEWDEIKQAYWRNEHDEYNSPYTAYNHLDKIIDMIEDLGKEDYKEMEKSLYSGF